MNTLILRLLAQIGIELGVCAAFLALAVKDIVALGEVERIVQLWEKHAQPIRVRHVPLKAHDLSSQCCSKKTSSRDKRERPTPEEQHSKETVTEEPVIAEQVLIFEDE
jgi:hypothetical protein